MDNDCDGEVDAILFRDCSSQCGSGDEQCRGGVWIDCSAPPVIDEVAGGFRMLTLPDFHPWLSKLRQTRAMTKLWEKVEQLRPLIESLLPKPEASDD